MEGYDIHYDQQCVAWLRLNHPEAALHNNTQPSEPTSLLQEFSHITPLVPLPINPARPPSASSALQHMIASPLPLACSSFHPAVSASNLLPGIIASPLITSPSSPPAEAATISSPGSAVGLLPSTQTDGHNTSPLDKYLHLPTTIKKRKTPVASSDTRAIMGLEF